MSFGEEIRCSLDELHLIYNILQILNIYEAILLLLLSMEEDRR